MTVSTAGFAGCSGVLGDGGGGSSPRRTADQFVESIHEETGYDPDEFHHPDDAVSLYSYWGSDLDYSDASTTVVERDGGVATVTVAVELVDPEWSESRTFVYLLEMRTHEGEWWVYDVQTPVGTAEAFLEAVSDDDPAEVEGLLHPDNTVPPELSESGDYEYEITDVEYVGGDDAAATVAIRIESSYVWLGEEQTNTSTIYVEVRTLDHEWRVYSLPDDPEQQDT